ncbi:hypothetical protein IQ238_05985 [Pleurocapsales cyanobacterium LEGE 06147]|nr:hypothetical protein [Pleurocapsales cyanobacterium LEGE 06147]
MEEILLGDLTELDENNSILEQWIDADTGIGSKLQRLVAILSSTRVTGGDLDDDSYQAEVVGEEAVGGQNPTPDQSITEELLQAMGIDSVDGELLRAVEKLERRDRQRWELDPESSEDYPEHFND